MLSNKSCNFVRLALFLGCIWIKLGLISGQQDFQFENTNGDEDVQVVFSETTTESHYEHRLYEKEISQCGQDENKILLSLVLRSHQWNEIIDKKKEKAVNKLSNFFAIRKNAIHLENVSRKDIYEMTQASSRRGLSRLNGGHNKYLGRLQFQIGCGKIIFSSQQPHVNRIAEQMADGTISDVAGLEFGLWAIWTKPVDNRMPRAKRDADEGSGEYDEDGEYYEEDDNEEDDGEYGEDVTEIPAESSNKHKNRHHHGEKQTNDRSASSNNSNDNNNNNNNNDNSNKLTSRISDSPPSPTTTTMKNLQSFKYDDDGVIDTSTRSLIKITKTMVDDDMKESLSKLESDIIKTIENNTNKLKESDDEISKILTDKHKNRLIDDKLFDDIIPLSETITDSEQIEIITKKTNGYDSDNGQSDDTIISDDDYIIEDIDKIVTTSGPPIKIPIGVDYKFNLQETTTIPSPSSSFGIVVVTDNIKQTTTLPPSSSSSSSSSSSLQLASSNGSWLSSSKNHLLTTIPSNEYINSRNSKLTNINHNYETTTLLQDNIIITTKNLVNTKDAQDGEEEEEEDEYLPNKPTEEAQPVTTTARSTTPIVYKVQPRINLSSSRTLFLPSTEQAILTTTTDEPTLPVIPQKSDEDGEDSDDYDPDVYDDLDDYPEYIPPTELPSTTPPTTTTTTKTTTEKIIIPITDPITNTTERLTTTPVTSTTTTTESPTTTPVPTTTEKTTTTTTTTQEPTTIPTEPPTTTTTTLAPSTTVPTIPPTTTTEYFENIEPVNTPPLIKNRMPKQPLTAGKPFTLKIPLDIFYDNEDGTNLKLELLDKHDLPLKTNSWLQFDAGKREIYGLPLEDVVSKWVYYLKATDSSGTSVTEILDLTVQQHKTHRSENHEINIGVRLLEKFRTNVDWQIRLIRGIAETLGETSTSNIVVREIRIGSMDPTSATFVYSNETLPKERCPEDKLDQIMKRLTVNSLSDALSPEMSVKSIQAELIGSCKKATQTITEINSSPKNVAPIPRNAVDFMQATVGQLLVYKVPQDTFYDSNQPILKLSLLTADRTSLDPKNWLQFDSKNEEFFGIPKQTDIGQREYLLVAEDRGGLTATDALVVTVKAQPKRDYSVQFEMSLGIPFENFNNSGSQRRFVERTSSIFNDSSTSYIYVRQIRPIFNYTLVYFYNTTLYRLHSQCPDDEIDRIRNLYTYSDGTIRDRVREIMGSEFNILNISFIPVGSCQGIDTIHHPEIITPIHKPSNEPAPPPTKDDYLLTFVLPAVIIISMLIFASVIACYLHRRRLTGKMELGDEEERRSFRSKGIPVIFQDELDEKPEIGNKSPVILKDEKPPLLPPSYNSTNPDDNDDVDDYVPPPAVLMGGRESRGKSPVTPSYRKPPPYVSP